MINNKDTFCSLLNEFFLYSEIQRSNPIHEIITNKNDILYSYYSLVIQKLEKLKDIQDNLFTQNEILTCYTELNGLFINYYLNNTSYFNYKARIDQLLPKLNVFHIEYSESSKFYLLNLTGMFLISSDFGKMSKYFLKKYISEKMLEDNGNYKSPFQREKLLALFTDIVYTVFNGIEFIEKLILAKYLNSSDQVSSSFIINSSDLKLKFQDIFPNKKIIMDWEEVFSFQINSLIPPHNLPPFDTNHLVNVENEKILSTIEIKNKIDFNKIDGLLIHAENFKGLQFLRNSNQKEIDCVYIDPPYNTGSEDFQYNDDYSNIHWYWFMENRLSLVYDLLQENGVVFVSIDDNQLVALRKILDSIFDRFIGMFVWHKKTQPSFLNKELISVTEYILVYKKGTNPIKLKGGLTDPHKHTELLNISNEVSTRVLPRDNTKIYNNGKLFTGTVEKGTYGNNKLEVTLNNTINVVNGLSKDDISLFGRFRWTQVKIDTIGEKENRYIVIKSLKTLRPTVSGTGKSKIRPPITLLSKKINDMPTNTDGNNEMKNLFKIPPFYYPKPVDLIKFLIESVTYNNKDAVILDFFAGSGTTGHAVINLNRVDGGRRKFILIEEADYFDTILVPRIKKSLYSSEWNKGIPLKKDNYESIIQIIRFKI